MKGKFSEIIDRQYEELLEYCINGLKFLLRKDSSIDVVLIDRWRSSKRLSIENGMLCFDPHQLSDGAGNYRQSTELEKFPVDSLTFNHIQREEVYYVAEKISRLIDSVDD